jgi:hypothetical protein
MPEVAYVQKNAARRRCYGCPVQKGSTCAQEKHAAVAGTLETSGPPPAPELPGLYCSSGLATCHDLDFTGMCRCMGCAVYAENGLDGWKYCQRGSAQQVG